MTSIKPPSAGPSSLPPASTEAVGSGPDAIRDATAPEGSAGATGAAGASEVGAPQGAQGGAASDAVAELAAAVEQGAITPTEAVEALLERTVAGVGRDLGQAERAELTTLLRAAIETDPVLRAALDPTS